MHYRVPVQRIYTYTYNNEFGQVLNFAVTCWYKRKGCLFWLNSKLAMFLISLVFFIKVQCKVLSIGLIQQELPYLMQDL